MKPTALSSALLLLLAASGAAFASTPISETRSVNADARIDVSNIKGDVTISGWDKNEVSITGTLGDGARKLAIDGGGSSLSIRSSRPTSRAGSTGAPSRAWVTPRSISRCRATPR